MASSPPPGLPDTLNPASIALPQTPLPFPIHCTVPMTPSASPFANSYFPSTPRKASISAPASRAGTTPTMQRLAEMSLRSPVPSGAASAGGLASGSSIPVLHLPGLSRPKAVSIPAGPAPTLFPPSTLAAYFPPSAEQKPTRDRSILILDLRPPSAFHASHLPHALSLPIPSTLLRRPAFPLASLSQMLPERSRAKFDSWTTADLVIVIEREREGLGDGGRGLVAKFEKELQAATGSSGPRVGGIKGGWEAVRKSLPQALVSGDDSSPPPPPLPTAATTASPKRPAMGNAGSSLRDLPMAAFQQRHPRPPRTVSTTSAAQRPVAIAPASPQPIPLLPPLSYPAPLTFGGQTTHHPTAPFPTVQPPRSAGAGEPSALPPASNTMLASNPFYDNIRQHLELAQGVTGTKFESLLLPARVRNYPRLHLLPAWVREIIGRAEMLETPTTDHSNRQQHAYISSSDPAQYKPDRGEALAMQFYKVELAEQRRLVGVMEHHSRESYYVPTATGGGGRSGDERAQRSAERESQDQADMMDTSGSGAGAGTGEEDRVENEFPYSITAGIEKGALNRYRNIWPFAHTRVRLPDGSASDGSDYVNASFVNPRGTRRRYVCAQGPLEVTRGDFWNLVWAQNITTIIMLTKQTEAGLSKCFPYWQGPMAGPFHLRHVSTTGGEDETGSATAGFFEIQGSIGEEKGAIRRVFGLSMDGVPGERTVTQLQMVSWPDWEVPRSPQTLLDLIKQTNVLRSASADSNAPVLVHCSAGVGRTGSFVLIDAVLDGLRAELEDTKSKLDLGQRIMRSPSDHREVHQLHLGDLGTASGNVTTTGSPSFSSLSLSLHRQSSLESSAPTSRSASTVSTPPSPPPGPIAFDIKAQPSATPAELPQAEANPQSQNAFDFNQPRSAVARQHPSRAPTPLSDMEPDPIRQVLEDMREQRMSLCQSLNQYVFCHRAICEGAIDLVEEIFGPTDYSFVPSGPSSISPNAMDIEHPFFSSASSSRPAGSAKSSYGQAGPMPLYHPHAKRAASKSPEEVERVLAFDSDSSDSGGYPSPRSGELPRKPSFKRQMTRRGEVNSGAASPGLR